MFDEAEDKLAQAKGLQLWVVIFSKFCESSNGS